MKKKALIIVSIIIASLGLIYAGGGLLAASITANTIFNHRLSVIDDLDEVHFVKYQSQYPGLSERKTFTFPSDGEELQGYLYENPNPKGLLISVHGIYSMADATHAGYQNYFLNRGYDVLSIDLTASGRSSGDNAKGLHQSAIDVYNCLRYVHASDGIKDLPIMMIGHSWGGYGVSAALNFDQSPKMVVSFSGYDSPKGEMFGLARQYAGPIAYAGKWQIDLALDWYSGYSSLRAIDGINKAKDTYFYCVQGAKDDIVPYEASIYGKLGEAKGNRRTKYMKEGFGHTYMWHSPSALNYIKEKENEYEALKSKYDGELPKDMEEEFISSIDYDKSSELDETLLNHIDSLFDSLI